MAPFAGGGNMNPIDFKQKVIANVEHVIGRINGIAPQYFSEEVTSASDLLNNIELRITCNDIEFERMSHKMSNNAFSDFSI